MITIYRNNIVKFCGILILFVFTKAWSQTEILLSSDYYQTVPSGKVWILKTGKSTKCEFSFNPNQMGSLCSAQLIKDLKLIGVCEGERPNIKVFPVYLSEYKKADITDKFIFQITLSKNDEIVFLPGAKVFLNGCLYSFYITEISVNDKQLEEYRLKKEKVMKEYDNSQATSYFKEGMRLKTGERFDEAIDYFSQSISLNPTFSEAYYQRGHCKGLMARLEASIEDYNKAIELDQNNDEALNGRAATSAELGNDASALKDYTKAIKLQPNNVEYLINRAVLELKINQLDDALSDLNKVIGNDSKNIRAIMERGNVYQAKKELSLAMTDYNYVIENDKKNDLAFANRGLLKCGSKDYQGAIDDYTKAIELNKENYWTYLQRGLAFGYLGKYQEALPDLTKAIESNSQFSVTALYYRGFSKYNLKDNGACKDWKEASEKGLKVATDALNKYCKSKGSN